ncbi:DUF1467 family protein [Rhizobium sp. CG4]|jgi:predicted secreted protein|uniref:DUF1467 family protein n=1 Tax=Rhizobium/Agrobacterium group TaxID=227290 RepID=UPI000F9A50A9|nr:DUF1467 family protein [Rhizobium sp. CG4]MCM2455225.1 DUF1467 family protein [Rhizobium sp. CG4]
MTVLSYFAIYFVIWWTTLFIVLPIGLRTQAEEGAVEPGTVASAPARFRGLKVIALNTAVSAALLASWLFLTWWFNFELEDIFELFPMFNR